MDERKYPTLSFYAKLHNNIPRIVKNLNVNKLKEINL